VILQAGAMAAAGLLIDTDPGSFTDDTAAIVMCLRSPTKVSVRGLTVVSGNVWAQDGERHLESSLAVLGRRAPVHLGSQRPLVHTPEMSRQQGPLEFAGAFAEPEPPQRPETAVDFLLRELELRSATILAIGPLTNIARLLERKPTIARRIERLVIMGGNLDVPGNVTKSAEFNFWFDPEAARAVLRSDIAKKVLVPLDVCNKAPVLRRHFDEVVAVDTPVTRLYRESFGMKWPGFLIKPEARGYLWDELAAAYVLDPSVATRIVTRRVDVVTEFGPRYGAVVAGDSAVDVVMDADVERAWGMVRRLLTRR
jgi:inosine-uridine nucleoside N-ribohydrolase